MEDTIQAREIETPMHDLPMTADSEIQRVKTRLDPETDNRRVIQSLPTAMAATVTYEPPVVNPFTFRIELVSTSE